MSEALAELRLVGVFRGGVRSWGGASRTFATGFFKSAVEDAVQVTEQGLEGDAQADRKHHGGPDKAVCLYPEGHYPYWRQRLGRELPPPAFGENLLVAGIDEHGLCLGDILEIGSVALQVTRPRSPCHKLGAIHGQRLLPRWVQETGFTGAYLRCVRPGWMRAGDIVVRRRVEDDAISIAQVNRVMHDRVRDVELIERVLALTTLADGLRGRLEDRLAGRVEDSRRRLYGTA